MKFVSLVSSGIDSPVATYVLSRKKEEIMLLHADTRPFTYDRELEKFKELAHHLKQLVPGTITAYIIPHGPALTAYKTACNPRYTCVFCKRMLLRYAACFCKKEHADAIIMGDSLGQVASQTLQNLNVIEEAIDTPVLRPLIGYDKEEIITIAKTIGTYTLSIAQAAACAAVPQKPSTQAHLDAIHAEEKKLDLTALIDTAIQNATSLPL
jgi:thiamine biosynthesis protein ThiI